MITLKKHNDGVVNITPPIDPPTGVLTYDQNTRLFTAPDGMKYADVSGAGMLNGIPTSFGTRFTVAQNTGNDFQAFQDAIDLAVANNGGEIYLPNGTYTFSSYLQIPITTNGITITGQSRTGTILNFTSTLPNNKGFISFEGSVPTPRQNLISNSAFNSRVIRINPAELTQHQSWYAVGKHLYLRCQIPTQYQEEYKLYFSGGGNLDYYYNIFEITARDLGTGDITLNTWIDDDDGITVARGARCYPVTVIKNCGVQNLTLNGPPGLTTFPYAHGIYFYYAWNCFARNITMSNHICYPIHFRESRYCELRDCEFFKPQQINAGAFGYAGIVGAYNTWIDRCIYHQHRHAIHQGYCTTGAITNCEFDGCDVHIGHAQWSRRMVFANNVVYKDPSTKPQFIIFGAIPNNTQHTPQGPYCSAYYNYFGQFPTRYGGVGMQLGSHNRGAVYSHNWMESGLYHNDARNPLLKIYTDIEDAYIINNVWVYDEAKTWYQDRECFVDFVPGTRTNWTNPATGTNYPFIQTGLNTYPSLQNYPVYEPTAPETDNTSTVYFRDNFVHGVDSSKLWFGWNGKGPTANDNTVAYPTYNPANPPARPIPNGGILDLVAAMKQYKFENPNQFI